MFKLILIVFIISAVCSIIKKAWKLALIIIIAATLFGGESLSLAKYAETINTGWNYTKDYVDKNKDKIDNLVDEINANYPSNNRNNN